jgi:opacity protein-like surface antigen
MRLRSIASPGLCLPLAVLALCAFAIPVRASAISGLEVMTSTIFQQHQSSLSGLAARLSMKSVRLVPGIDFLPTIEYWRNHVSLETYQIESTRSDATLGVMARYTFHHEGWSPYAGLGLGAHFISTKVNAPLLGIFNQEHSVTMGAPALVGGVTFPLQGSVDSFIDLEYHAIADQEQTKINWGLGFRF